ncbi:MAG TPA: beta-mannosidase [Mycobacterium sp.]|nr:beta-mannosidase [Mycobacterium sp.]
MVRLRRVLLRLLLIAVLVLTGCESGFHEYIPQSSTPKAPGTGSQPRSGPSAVRTPSAAGHVAISGTSLTLNGQPWWPIGINAYQLGTNWNINAGCGAQVDLNEFFSRLPPHSLVRFNAYSSFALNKHTGMMDFTALDRVFDTANRYQQLLLPVLTGDEGGCEDDRVKEYPWYASEWRTYTGPGVPISFGDWLDTAVKRWGSEPSVIGWTTVGEPEPSICPPGHCHWERRSCPTDSPQVLRKFFTDTGARIHELAPGALVFSGRVGGGQCGSAGEDFSYTEASPGIDVLEYHDYYPATSLPGDSVSGLLRRIAEAHALNKPLVVAEININAGSCLPLNARYRIITTAIANQRTEGTAGALFWAFVPDPRYQECTFDIGYNDPLFAKVGR